MNSFKSKKRFSFLFFVIIISFLVFIRPGLVKAGGSTTTTSTTSYKNGLYVIQKVQIINGRASYYNLGSYRDFTTALNRMNQLPKRDASGKFINMIIVHKSSLSPMKIMASNNAYAVVWPLHGSSNSKNLSTTTNILNSSLSSLTYVSSGSVGKYNHISTINGRRYANVTISGRTGYVDLNKLDLIPTVLIENSIPVQYANYTNNPLKVDLYRAVSRNNHKELQNRAFNTNYYTPIGVAPAWMKTGKTYYSVDGNYFYNDIYMTSRANSTPYYNYYQYLPIESKSKVTATVLNKFVVNMVGSRKSAMRNLGYAFINGQNRTDTNALLTFSLAIVESGAGTSRIALDKNNLFGWKAYDSSPYSSANSFTTPQQAVNSMMATNLKDYTNTTSWRYAGSFFGNKASGLNVRYASATDWGKIIASVAYRVDLMNGLADYNSYQLARVKDDYSLNLYRKPSTSSGIIKVAKSQSTNRVYNLRLSSNSQHRDQFLIAVDNPSAKKLGYQEVKLPNSASAGARFDTISAYVKYNGLTFVNKAKSKKTSEPSSQQKSGSTSTRSNGQTTSPSIPTTGANLYVKGAANIRSSMYTRSNSNVIGKLYRGQLIKGTRVGNFYRFTYKGRTAYIYYTNVSYSQISAEAFTSSSSNIRYTSNNKVASVYEKGKSVTGIQKGNKLFFTINGRSVYVYSSLLTYGNRQTLYVNSLSNIRDSKNRIIGVCPPEKKINAVLMGNYYRFYENGKIKFIYKSLVSSRIKKIEAFTNKTLNVYNYTGSKLLGKIKIGSYVHGVIDGSYIYFNYNGSSARILKSNVVSGKHTRVYAKEKVIVRNQDYIYQYTLNKGESFLGLKVGNYYRFWKDGKIYIAWAGCFR